MSPEEGVLHSFMTESEAEALTVTSEKFHKEYLEAETIFAVCKSRYDGEDGWLIEGLQKVFTKNDFFKIYAAVKSEGPIAPALVDDAVVVHEIVEAIADSMAEGADRQLLLSDYTRASEDKLLQAWEAKVA